eukprot:1158508-Pelagomonas_calceolata.AAC.30
MATYEVTWTCKISVKRKKWKSRQQQKRSLHHGRTNIIKEQMTPGAKAPCFPHRKKGRVSTEAFNGGQNVAAGAKL